jgi:exopolysaccharide biosynthesis polyprenyl glycosylphosphotransferase
MWTNVLVQRAVTALVFMVTATIGLHAWIPALRTPVASGLLAVTVFLLVARPIARETRRSSRFRTRVLLVGNGPLARKFVDEIEAHPERGYSIVGFVREESSLQVPSYAYLVLGALSELDMIVRAVRPDRIVVALSDRRGRMPVTQLLEFQLDGIVVEDISDAYERFSGKLAIESITPGQLIASQQMNKSLALKAAQRAVSFCVALIAVVVAAPILALIALAIKLDDLKSPVFFHQTRLGKGMRPFQLIKFRTMRPSDCPTSEWCGDNLDRITRVGKWLRRFRFDELPQLINVIRGDMNLVGPRPHPVCNLELFREAIPYYRARCSILPGITGWAQTRYSYANNLEEEIEKMRYDLYYVKHMSVWNDLRIIFDTCHKFVCTTTKYAEKRPKLQPLPRRELRQRATLKLKMPSSLPRPRYEGNVQEAAEL